MASQQPMQPSRPPSHRPQPSQRASSNPPSTTSIDSQTVYLNDTKSSPSSSSKTDPFQGRASSAPPRPAFEEEPNKCWICFSDETEDTPDSSPWRSPCPCALTAHEACLLDWIADMESPGSNRSTTKQTDIKCPQCKAPIHLARSRSYIVDGLSAIESFTGKMLLPAFMCGLSYTVLLAASHHGALTIRMIFGTEDADLILAPARRWNWLEQAAVQYFPTIATPVLRNWRGLRVELGLPLIPAALIASRTSIADAVLPVLPIVFFATHPQASRSLAVGYWPPSAALTFVILPYIRSAYDEYIERIWGEHERRWLKEIKPRQGQEEAEAGAAEQGDDIEEEILQFEVVIGEEAEDPVAPAEREQAIAHPLYAPPTDMAQGQDNVVRAEIEAAALAAAVEAAQEQRPGANAEPAEAQAQGQQQQPQRQVRGGIELIQLAQSAGSSVLGALVFPIAAAGSGEILQFLLPLTWTMSRRGPKGQLLPPTGLLQTRWGRSVIGGCLFVALKDAIRIYCRWRTAKDFRNRRVLNWDKKARKLVD